MLQPWVVIVKYGFNSREDRDAYMEHFAELSEHVLEHEPEVASPGNAWLVPVDEQLKPYTSSWRF